METHVNYEKKENKSNSSDHLIVALSYFDEYCSLKQWEQYFYFKGVKISHLWISLIKFEAG